jgi:hypothetical protein
VEQQVVARAEKDFGQTATSAACPIAALPTVGSKFSCTETLKDGKTGIVSVTVTDDTGSVTWVPAAG